MTPSRRRTLITALAALGALLAAGAAPATAPAAASGVEDFLPARSWQPVILVGSQIPEWSRLAAVGAALPWPSGTEADFRDAHNGTLTVPPDARAGVPVEHVTAWRWEADKGRFKEIPVQVDERFPYFLANGRSSFGLYSATDEELTYEWDVETWLKTDGVCAATYPPGVAKTEDPVTAFDDDDEIVFMSSDTGPRAPRDALGPPNSGDRRIEVAIADPATGTMRYAYLFLRPDGPETERSYVSYARDADSDQWVDFKSFDWQNGDPEMLGTSNKGYGPNLHGTVCDPDGAVRLSEDRFPRDGLTVRTPTYEWRATGRWMIRGMSITKPGAAFDYGPDLIDRWKGRAFRQSPDSVIESAGFEDEQVNWEANSALLGERAGPVRAIREVWGADSGTNVTKTELFYRDTVAYRYRLRVHPVPPDGLYTSWDYNEGVAARYFNPIKPDGVTIDGVNDDVGNLDDGSLYYDAPDPTFNLPVQPLTWEQVSGAGDAGSLVYVVEIKSPTTLENPAVVPYYRDDACFDNGTGDDPAPRLFPGEPLSDEDLVATGYPGRDCSERQGAWGSHGIHYLFTNDTDNVFQPKPVTEVDSLEWQFAVPTASPESIGHRYSDAVRLPLVTTVAIQESSESKNGR